MWETPGGGLQPGETLEECLRREAREEIGIGIRIANEIPRFRSSTDIRHLDSETDAGWLMVYCRCEAEGKPDLSRALDAEFADLRYFSQDDFRCVVREGGASRAEERYLQDVMIDLGIWEPD